MGNPEKRNCTAKDSTQSNRARPGFWGRKFAGRGRSWIRLPRVLLLAAACCLAAVPSDAAEPSLLNSAAVDGNTAGGNTLPGFSISSGANRMLIVAVDDEKQTHVTAVSLGSVPMTLVGGYAEPDGLGNATSLWMILDADLPADGAYDVVVSGGNKPSVAAMLWSGLLQAVPAGSAVAGGGQDNDDKITTSVEVPGADSLVVATTGHGGVDEWDMPPAGWTRRWNVKPTSAFHVGATGIAADAGTISITEKLEDGDFNRAAQFVAAFAPVVLDPAPGCPGCRYRRSITIDPDKLGDSCAGDMAGFPVLVTIENATSLKSVANGGHVGNGSGYDIAFTDAGGAPLYHEVERYDAARGTLVAWVRVPTLSASGATVIYMLYGDSTVSAPAARPGSVWDDNYKGVWHLNQASTNSPGEILDSTAGANNGQSFNMEAGDRTTGRIADALDFDGINDYVNIGTPLGSADAVTVSAWVKHEGIEDLVERYVNLGNYIVIRHDGQNSVGQLHFYIRTGPANTNRSLRVNNVLTMGAWYYVVGTWDGTTQRVYANGQQRGSQVPPAGALSTPGGGTISQVVETMDGIIDEVRISNVARDVCWIETEYSNQGNPAAFHTIGDEELVNEDPVPTWTITATALPNGSITPSGAVVVEEGDSPIFILEPADNYEVDKISINGGAFQDYGSRQYQFSNVTANGTIFVTFIAVAAEPPPADDELPPGCLQNKVTDYSDGFDPDKLQTLNAEVDADSHVRLNTGDAAINPDSIVIPFRQEVAVSFLFEGGNNDESDFGWMLGGEDPYADPAPHRIIYENINDNDNNGVLDVDGGDTTDRFGDRNGDGKVDALDNREVLGTFDAGTELVFFLKIDEGQGYRNNMSNENSPDGKVTDFGKQNEQVYHYTKTAWNQSRFTSRETLTSPELSCSRDWGTPPTFTKNYNLGLADSFTACSQNDGWMDADGLARAADPFGLHFDADDTASLSVTWDERWPAVMVGAPANDPNAWVLGFEDLLGGGDMDNNDVVFIIERETGGTAALKSEAAITPDDPNAVITGVTLGVWDFMPDEACVGKTEIVYWLSIDDGQNWVKVDGWDQVYKFRLQDDQKILLDTVTNWSPGTPSRS